MNGKYHITVSSNRVIYDFDIERNITVIKGDSAKGKSYLVDMIRRSIYDQAEGIKVEHKRYGKSSDANIDILQRGTKRWYNLIKESSNVIYFVDEDVDYIRTGEFAKVFSESGNYLVFVSRGELKNLAYSIKSVKKIVCDSSKKPVVNTLKSVAENIKGCVNPEIIIIEDSRTGFEVLKESLNRGILEARIIEGKSLRLPKFITAGGNGNITRVLDDVLSNSNTGDVFIIADGAAFGSLYNGTLSKIREYEINFNKNVYLALPESFEWLCLNTNRIKRSIRGKQRGLLDDKIKRVYDYIDYNKDCVSWENYYVELLNSVLRNFYKQRYSKSNVPKMLEDKILQYEIFKQMEDLKAVQICNNDKRNSREGRGEWR